MSGSTVGLVLVPGLERDLQSLHSGTPVWVASVESMKATLTAAHVSGLLVTELLPNGEGPLEWIHNHRDSLDQHHNDCSGDVPVPYRKLLVFGKDRNDKAPPIPRPAVPAPLPAPASGPRTGI